MNEAPINFASFDAVFFSRSATDLEQGKRNAIVARGRVAEGRRQRSREEWCSSENERREHGGREKRERERERERPRGPRKRKLRAAAG